mmetsp:Transcript_19014/g.28573  ORF Transcript_19014/g.28573 Transcript_19014/m.28573 type:complete len:291 (-) Transcript_19014:280-1152(-)
MENSSILAYCEEGTLNDDPYNKKAEEMAVAECAQGVKVSRVWSEQELVRSFSGRMFPGTPDGMFESAQGDITCVQVVRVPIIVHMTPTQMETALRDTVLAKVEKSQQWLRACRCEPANFVIFCWLPFAVPESVMSVTFELMDRVRCKDRRFSLKLRVPPDPADLFPTRFAAHVIDYGFERRRRTVSESDITVYTGSDLDSEEEDDLCSWDITWDWGLSESCTPCSSECETSDESNWDITWEWQSTVDISTLWHVHPESLDIRSSEQGVLPGIVQRASVSGLGRLIWDSGG